MGMGMGANKEQEREKEPEPLPVGGQERERERLIKEVGDRLLYGICNGTGTLHQWSLGDPYPLPQHIRLQNRTDLCVNCDQWRSFVRKGGGDWELTESGDD